MRYPNFNEEKKLWKKGYKYVVGLDEAGRGALAAPVVAAAVIVNSKFKPQNSKLFKKVNDSKKLSPKKREELFKILTNCDFIEWGIGRVSEKVIDRINILEATKLAMKKAVRNLEKKLQNRPRQKSSDRTIFGVVDFLILDGNFKINTDHPQKSIIKADEKVFSCACASILAKVRRDKIMLRYHKKYPQYRFDKHKGYPTRLHRKMLKKYSSSVIHRLTFINGKKYGIKNKIVI